MAREKLSDKVKRLEAELEATANRVSNKDFYQGLAWGAGWTAAIGLIIYLFS